MHEIKQKVDGLIEDMNIVKSSVEGLIEDMDFVKPTLSKIGNRLDNIEGEIIKLNPESRATLREIYNRYSDYHFDPIESNGEFDISVFTDSEKAVIDSVIQNLCCYSGKVLERFTHSEMPWLRTRGNLPADVHSDRVIRKEMIGEFFTATKEKYEKLTPDDIENYMHHMFKRLSGSRDRLKIN